MNADSDPPDPNENPAMDGVIQEYARLGGPGDDESFLAAVKRRIEELASGRGGETDWPWLFGPAFWKVAALITFLAMAGIGTRTWQVATARPDPTEVFVFSQPRAAPGAEVAVRVLARDADKRDPIAGASLRLMMVGPGLRRALGTASTGEDGVATLSASLPDNLAEGEYTLTVDLRDGKGRAQAEQNLLIRRSFKTLLSSDKPLYQPGQTIHLRAVSLEADTLLPAGEREVQFEIRDPKGNKVFRAVEETSEFGIASAQFALANQVNEGSYTLAVTLDDTTSEKEVKVERYTLPKYGISLSPDRSYYQPGETMQLSLQADYTFGKPVAGAEVEIRADEFIERFRTFATLKGKTNEEGTLTVPLPLKDAFVGQPLHQGNAFVRLVASVTDLSGETREMSRQVIITTEPLRVEVFPESGTLVQGVPNTLFVVTAYPDGRPAPAVVYTGGGTRVPTNEMGIGKLTLTPEKTNLKLTLSARTRDGAEATVVRKLRVDSQEEGILLRTDRAVYKQGQTAEVRLLSSSRARRVFLDVVKNGRSFSTHSIPLSQSKGTHALDLPPDLSGTVQLQAYAISDRGELIRDTKVIQVLPARQLQITATLDSESYRPAQKALIRFLVTSPDGEPVPAALSLAAVDEAVFALQDMRPGLEEMYFLIQEEILAPKYQLVARPAVDYTSLPAEENPELEEARVVLFSAAPGEAGPAAAQGATLQERKRELDSRRRDYQAWLISLLALGPFTLGCLSIFPFLVYGILRVRFRPSWTDDVQLKIFRDRMRHLFWILVGGIYSFPVSLMALNALQLSHREAVVLGVLILLAVIFTVSLAVKAHDLRKLDYCARHLHLFRRLVGVVPTLFLLSFLTMIGAWWAHEIKRQAVPENLALTLLLSCLVLLLLTAGTLGYLAGGLTRARSAGRNGLAFLLHAVLPASPLILLLTIGVSTSNRAMAAMGGEVLMDLEAAAEGGIAFDALAQRMTKNGDVVASAAPLTLTGTAQEPAPPRVRKYFPETLLWRPQLLTDAEGKAELSLSLADSITTWRLSGSAISRSGQFGSVETGIQVFQDFFVDIDFPTQLTQNDEIEIPVAIFNYLEVPQTLELQVQPGEWYELVEDEPTKSVQAGPGEILSVPFRLRALRPGRHSLSIMAQGSALSDAVERTVRVIPDGVRHEQVINGKLSEATTETVSVPEGAIPGGSDLFLKIYPGAFSQVVEGMDGIFRMPFGCFEQTSSTTYPNILVLDYMRQTGQVKPELEMKALNFIQAGYQRLLSYEVDGGGFEWFGRAPAHNILTAYGLLEFVDMNRVYEIDPAILTRTRDWLLDQQEEDGTWKPSQGGIAEGAINQFRQDDEAILRATAYITWAIAEAGGSPDLDASFDRLAALSDSSKDPYSLALVANAFLAAERDQEAGEILKVLSRLKTEEGDFTFWTAEGSALTHGRGDAFAIETTALIAQALLRAQQDVGTAHRSLAWLISKRDSGGTWQSTQATVQAMRALLLGASKAGQVDGELTVAIQANGAATNPIQITPENSDVFHLISLTEMVQPGTNQIEIAPSANTNLAYQIVAIHYEPAQTTSPPERPLLEIDTEYSTTELSTKDLLTVTISLKYHRPEAAPMTLVDLGLPPGFEIDPASFQDLVEQNLITRFEPKGRQVTLYFESVPGGGEPTSFSVRYRAKFPVKAQAPRSVAYQYYEPEVRAESEPVLITVQ